LISDYFLGKENRHPITSEIIDPDPDRKYAYVFLVNMKIFVFELVSRNFLEK
jgi:hypothetical protein